MMEFTVLEYDSEIVYCCSVSAVSLKTSFDGFLNEALVSGVCVGGVSDEDAERIKAVIMRFDEE